MNRTMLGAVAAMMSLSLLATACNQDDALDRQDGSSGANVLTGQATFEAYRGGPVELTVLNRNAGVGGAFFQEYIAGPVKAAFPDITLKLVEGKLEELIASGATPDLVADSSPYLRQLTLLDYPADISEPIKRFGFDLDLLDPTMVGDLQATGSKLGGNGAILGIPFGLNFGALIYNKSLFDKFGVAYPPEGITWEQMIDLAAKLSRTEDGIHYVGGTPNSYFNFFKQYGLAFTDEADKAARFTTDGHQRVARLIERFLQLPGFVDREKGTFSQTNFFNGQSIGMMPTWLASIAQTIRQRPLAFEWDLTTYPVFSERPQAGAPLDYHLLHVSKSTPHKEAAYRAALVLASAKPQAAMNRSGERMSVLRDPALKQDFAADSAVFDKKNLKAVFRVSPAPVAAPSLHGTEAFSATNELVKQMALQGADINSALRAAEMQADQAIRKKSQ